MESEAFKWSVEVLQSHLSWFLPVQQRCLLWCGLGCPWLQCYKNKRKGQGFYLPVPASCRCDQGKGSRHGMRSLVWHCLLFSVPFCTVCVSGSDDSWHAVLNWVSSQGSFQQKWSGWKAQKAWWWWKIKQNYQWSSEKCYRKMTLLWDWRLDDQPILKISGKNAQKTQMRVELLVWKKPIKQKKSV